MAFTGFSPQALRFLRDLKKNNERDWFQAHKDIYERELLAPLQALASDVSVAMRKAKIPIAADPRRVSFRIYRDVRFSNDKSPYKTNLGTYLPHGGLRDSPGGLYVHIEPRASFMAVAFYQLEKPQLQAWRLAMAKEPARFERVLRALERNGTKLSEQDDSLKRMPRGFEDHADGSIAPYFRLKSFIVSETLSDSDVSDAGLIERSVGLAKNAKPLLEYGWSVLSE